MTIARQLGWTALVVGTDIAQRTALARILKDAGYGVAVADSFEGACARLAAEPPDILVTDLRLGAYNGLHLVWEQSFRQTDLPAIVICDPSDAVLESDARELNCRFLVKPVERVALEDVAATLVGANHLVSAHHLSGRSAGVESGPKVTA